jgi:hypothetical protein
LVIAGELGAYNFPELREAAHALVGRGVRFAAYANEPSEQTRRALIRAGVDLSVGRLRSRHHYLVIDRLHVTTSVKERSGVPTPTGSRRAVMDRDDAALAGAITRYAEFLSSMAKTEEIVPRRDLMRLLDAVHDAPGIGRLVPLEENILVLAGKTDEEARAFGKEARDQIHQALSDEGSPPGPMTEQTLLNEMCLRTAALLVH